jgi:hypothetical protein
MLNLVDQPVGISLARNPMVVWLKAFGSSSELFSPRGVSASLELALTDRFDANETITVDYTAADGTSETVVFTAKASPALDTEFPDGSATWDDVEYWTRIAQIVGGHPRIAPFFEVEIWTTPLFQTTLRVLARDPNVEAWTVDMENTGGFTVVLDEEGKPDTTPENYRVLVEVFFEKTYRSGDYERVAQLTGTPEPELGFLYFDISSVLAAHCRASRADPLVPNWNTAGPFVADNLRRYYVRYTEEYGAPATVQPWAYTAVKLVVDGGVSQAVHKQSGYFGYLSTLDVNDSFLTWTPDGKRISTHTPEWLTWYNHTGVEQSVGLAFVRYDVDTGVGTGGFFPFSGPPLVVRPNECAVFPANLSSFLADVVIDTYTDVYKYTLRVIDTTSDWEGGSPVFLSEPRTYYIDREYYEGTRYVQYLNGFGVPETIRCTGEWGKRVEVNRSTAVRPLLPGYQATASDNFQHARDFTPILIYRTGYLRKGDAETLQELLIAGEVYDVSADGYIPLLITDNRFDVTSTYESLHAYQIACRPRLNMKNFSTKKLTQSDADAWEEPDGEFWFDALQVAWQMPA